MADLRNSLQLRQAQTQTLAMTPQLQQAIRLLQLSSLELTQEIQQAVDKNPMLEIDEETENSRMTSIEEMADAENRRDSGDGYNLFDNDSSIQPTQIDTQDSNQQDSFSDNAPDPILSSHEYIGAPAKNRSMSFDNDSVYEGETGESIQEHLRWQLELSPLAGKDRLIAENIIDAVNDSGYLTLSLTDLTESVRREYPDTNEDEVATVLKLVQHYDPVGIASRDVKECLSIQLEALPGRDKRKDLALQMINEYTSLLINKDFRSLCHKLKVREEDLREAWALILTLNPRPGHFVVREESSFIIPDVIVTKTAEGYQVSLNPDSRPHVRLNRHYQRLAERADNERDRQFFKGNLQDANFFLKSLQTRDDTLLKVSRCIVEHQTEFMEQGENAMQPMVLKDVAEEIEMHESTISRVTTEKYMHTPRGTFELKYFFSSSLDTEDGTAASSTAIRARIKELIAAENPRRPLPDSAIVEALGQQGIKVARRTVAKYREAMGIASTSKRKSLL